MEPLGIRNDNPGNLEIKAGQRWLGQSEVQRHHRFLTFDSPEYGIRAICKTLITYQDKRRANDGSRIDSIAEIIQRWAPHSDGNPMLNYGNYISCQINRSVNDETLDLYDYDTMRGVVCGIIGFENGRQPYSDDTIDLGLLMAGIMPPYQVQLKKAEPVIEPVKQPEPRKVKESKTIKAAAVGAVAVVATPIIEHVHVLRENLEPYADIGFVRWLLIGIPLGAFAYAAWERMKKLKQGI